jgi:hypothetical protein
MHDADDPDGPSIWHQLPKDDAWTCTLRGIADDGKRLWIECYGCGRFEYLPVIAWAEKHGVDLDTPLLLVNPWLRCRAHRKSLQWLKQEAQNSHRRHHDSS